MKKYIYTSKAPQSGEPATALALINPTAPPNRRPKMIPKARQNSPKCTHVGSKNEAPEGYPIGFSAEIRWGTPPGVGFSILYHVEARYARLL